MINTIESATSLIIFLPFKSEQKAAQQAQLSSMHDTIKNAINSFTQETNYAAGDKSIWIPQFKIGDKAS